MAKRAAGEGTVFKREGKNIHPNTLWCAQTPRIKLPDGRRKRFSFYGSTQAAAIRARSEGQEEIARVALLGGDGTTLSSFFETWTTHKRNADGLKFVSERNNRYDFEHYIKPHLGGSALPAVDALALQSLINDIAERGHVRTANKVRNVLSGMFKQALEWDLITVDPTARIKKIKAPPTILEDDEIEFEHLWTPAQTRAFLRVAEEGGSAPFYAYYPLFHLALNTGMREGEILGLQWRNVTPTTIKVRQTLHYVATRDLQKAQTSRNLRHVTGKFFLGPPKTAKGRRDLPLPAGLRERLFVMRERQEALKRTLGKEYEDLDFVFPTAAGTPIYYRNLLRTFKTLQQATQKSLSIVHDDAEFELPHIRFHDLRILYASNLVRVRKLPPTDIRDLLGHQTTDVAEKVYIRVMREQKASHAIELDELMTSDGGITDGITEEADADLLGITKEEKAA